MINNLPAHIHLQAIELEITTGAKLKLQVSYLGVTDVYETEKEAGEAVSNDKSLYQHYYNLLKTKNVYIY